MNTDRLVTVGIAWTLLIIGLLVLREFLRATDRPAAPAAVRTLNILLAVMLVGAGLVVALRLIAGTGQPGLASSSSEPSRTTGFQTSAPIGPTGAGTLAPSEATPSTDATSTPSGSPTPRPSPTPDPTRTPRPSRTPTLPPATQAPTPTPTPPPEPSGSITAGPDVRLYEVRRGEVVAYRDERADSRFTAESSEPGEYPFGTLSDPNGAVQLVRITAGPFEGEYISPDDDGVEYRPGS